MSTRPRPPMLSAAAETPLFRPEALAAQQSEWLGSVLLTPRLSHVTCTLVAAAAMAAVLALLVFADYTRKARLSGWLVPDTGQARVLAPQSGRVVELHVGEGAKVRQGQELAVISMDIRSEALGGTQAEIIRRLVSRRDSLLGEQQRLADLNVLQTEDLAERLASVRREAVHLERELTLQRERIALAEAAMVRQQGLRERGIITEEKLQAAREDRVDQARHLEELERATLTLARERSSLDVELRALPLRHRAQLAEIDRSVAAIQQELAEAEAQRESVVTAPQDGTVTAVRTSLGDSVDTGTQLFAILPAGAKLQAELFSPSDAVGFLRPGQRVLLRYRSFPYQKFGSHDGSIVAVSPSATSPADLPPALAGLTSLYSATEPVYRITVEPVRQTVTAYEEEVSLHPGMQLEADIHIERRRLIEWMLEPLYTLIGR